jgi:oxalate decarboxylase/phosphoglucose isomerase-like protein (cupin superfamily)
MSMEFIKTEDNVLTSIIIRRDFTPTETNFVTSPNLAQQVGFVVYPAGGVIKRHIHKNVDRQNISSSEALIVRQGRLEIDIYDQNRNLLATRQLQAGDFVLMVSGGHGFRILEAAILLEVKLGPYAGPADKELF